MKANLRTVVVVESGGAVFMPWAPQVPAILEAFYPGIRGGAAIARILIGKVNPSGHLPISFPASTDQLAHPVLPGLGQPNETPAQITYDEGAAVGYKWYDAKGYRPLFSFGHASQLHALCPFGPDGPSGREGRRVSYSSGMSASAQARPRQVYVAPRMGEDRLGSTEAARRLCQDNLKPGQRKRVELTIDPRLVATYEAAGNNWHRESGKYRMMLGQRPTTRCNRQT